MMRVERCLRQSSYGQSPRPGHGLRTAENLLAREANTAERPPMRSGCSAILPGPWHLRQYSAATRSLMIARVVLPALDPLLASFQYCTRNFGMQFSPHEPRRAILYVSLSPLHSPRATTFGSALGL